MADDRQEPREAPEDGGDRPGRGAALEHTQEFDPLAEESPEPAAAGELAGRPADDETRPNPWPGDEARTGRTPTDPWRAEDPSVPRPMDRTAGMPADRRTTAQAERPAPWSGRAEVPAGARYVRDAAPVDWEDGVDQADRRWWMPILVGVVALLLLGVLGFGLWLILRSNERGLLPVTPSATSTSSPTPAMTSAVPTTGQPTPSPTAAVPIPVPPVVGLPEAAARSLLDQVGLTYRLQFRASTLPAGTVIETDPPVGTLVAPGQQVTLVIADAPTEPPTMATPTTPAGPTPAA
jgi:hypothetical protein